MNGCIYRTADDKCEFWSDYGKNIVSYCDFEDCDEKKPSNADRIRSMTDEELAEWIAYRQGCFERQDKRCSKYGTCRDCWFDWLKEECDS